MKESQLTLVFIICANLLHAQLANRLYVEGIDSTKITLESKYTGAIPVLGSPGASKLEMETDIDNKIDSWIFQSTPQAEQFRLDYRNLGSSFPAFTSYAKNPYQMGFGGASPSSAFEFQVAWDKAMLLKAGNTDPGLEFKTGFNKTSIINGNLNLSLGVNDQESMQIDFTGNVKVAGDIKTEDAFILEYPGGYWELGIGGSGCPDEFQGGPQLGISNSEFGVVASITAGDGHYCNVSDVRKKKNLEPITQITNKLMQLNPVRYQYRDQADEARHTIGLIAQEVIKVFPELVSHQSDGKYYQIKYRALAVLAIQMAKEQKELLNEYHQKLAQLKQEIYSLYQQRSHRP